MPKQQRKVFVTIRETLAEARFGCIPTNILVINMMLEKEKQKVQSWENKIVIQASWVIGMLSRA